MAAARYIERDPVCARLVERAEDWSGFLVSEVEAEEAEQLRRHERTGRPLGSASFMDRLESVLARNLHRHKPGPRGEGSDN